VGKGPEFAIHSKPKNKKPFHNKRRPAKKEWLVANYELRILQLNLNFSKNNQSPKILIS
jgi:hypothetical protein